MATPITVAAVCGSLRDASHTRTALRFLLETCADRGARTDLVDLRSIHLPVFDADDREAGDADVLADRLGAADSIVLGTPMYHGSYSSTIKTALDYCGFDEFEHKTIGLLAVAGGSFPITALEHLRSVCRALNAWVIPHQVAIPNAGDRIEAGSIVDAAIERRVAKLGDHAVRFANIDPESTSFEGDHNVGAAD